ncbi:MAG: AAA family ATPase [Bacteroidia bacterium]
MEKNRITELVDFFRSIRISEKDVTTKSEKSEGQYVVIVTYEYSEKKYTTKRLYYKDINVAKNVKEPERLNNYFGKPVYWLDHKEHDWPQGEGDAEIDETIIQDMINPGDTEFSGFLNSLANNKGTGKIQEITSAGKSAHYSFNLENNNHWHDIILLIQAIIDSKGEMPDKKYFSRLIFQWQNHNRASLSPAFGDRAIITSLLNNIKSIQNYLNSMETINEAINLLRYSKPQIILQGPPGTGKTRMAKMIAQKMTNSNSGTPLSRIDDFFKNFDDQGADVKQKRMEMGNLLKDFQSKFPIAQLKNLTLEQYVIGTGRKDTFCWWIERGLKPVNYYFPGTSRSYLIYWSKSKNDYSRHFKHSRILLETASIEDAMHKLAGIISTIVEKKDPSVAHNLLGSSLILKILHSYYPNEYFPVNSVEYLNKILSVLKIDYSKMDFIAKNQAIQGFYKKKAKEINSTATNLEFMYFLVDEFVNNETIGEYKIIQFHPAYSYEDFVRGISAKTNKNGNVYYEVENKVLAEFAENALGNPSASYVLVIDEINRANLPAVLGELIYALEYRYDETNPDETTVESMYSLISDNDGEEDEGERKLKLPKNLYIIGTMNTADRSVGHIDYAIRRRFAFVDVLPEKDVIGEVIKDEGNRIFAEKYYDLVAKLFMPNEGNKSYKYLAPDFKPEQVQIGHSYFLTEKAGGEGKQELEMKIKYEIVPILKEYLKDGILLPEAEEIIKELEIK